MNRISKFKFYILYTFAVNVAVFTLICGFYNISPTNIKIISSFENSSTPADSSRNNYHSPTNATQRRNIFFLKTHKTASSTVQNIIMRFGLRHSLNFMLPKTNNYLGYVNPIQMQDFVPDSVPVDNKFNILTHHSRYRRETNQFLYPDTVRVTLLRDPPELFESVFSYYNLHKVYNVSLRQFLDSLPRFNDPRLSSKRKIRGRNQMSRDLGLQPICEKNRTEISNFISFIDEQFDFVMIREHLEASLVLLANLMGWPLHYVSFFPMNVRKRTHRNALTQTDRFKLTQYNYADQLLYEHFLRKFRRTVLDYGMERMAEDLQKLHSINTKLRERCVLEENENGSSHTIGYVVKDPSDWQCTHSTATELHFTDELRQEQIVRLKPLKRLENLVKFHSRQR